MSSQEIQNKLNTALTHHKSGKLPEAEIIYRQIIAEDPENASALNLFGLLLLQHGRYDEAVDLIKKAIEIKPIPYFYINLGNLYLAKNEPDTAINNYTKAMEMEPNNYESWFGLGMCYKNKKNYDKAIEYYEKAISLNPACYPAFINLGNIYKLKNDLYKAIEHYKKAILFNQNDYDVYNSLGLLFFDVYELDEAAYCFEKSINIKPNYENAYINLGNVYKIKDEPQKAMNYFNMVLEMNPDNYDAYINLGNMMIYINKTNEAVDYFLMALKTKPDEAAVFLNLGNAYKEGGNLEKALAYYQSALKLMPDKAEVYVNLGNIYSDMHDFETAISYFNKAIEMNPDIVEAHLNLGSLYIQNKETEKAMDCLNKALAINPYYAETHLILATTYLSKKDFANGFKHYLWRDKIRNIKHPKFSQFQKPKWNGEPLENRTLLISPEQGFGDTLQFIRYLPQLSSFGGQILFKSPKGMEELLNSNDFGVKILDSPTNDDQIQFDCYTHLLNLPHYLNSSYDNIPMKGSYLKANPDKVNDCKEKYFNNNKFKIGIKWQGNPYGDKTRAIPLDLMLKLTEIDNIKLYSFQKGYGIKDLEKIPEGTEIIDLGNTFNDFSDTAAALENIDLLISNDTSLVHLSGALAKNTWVLLPYVSEWRWFDDTENSAWYNSVRLFRQKEEGNWVELIDTVFNELQNKLKS
jgi:tetratricopeptide (TPR) repeat protein